MDIPQPAGQRRKWYFRTLTSDPFKDNLLAEVKVGYSKDYRFTAAEGTGQEW